MDHHIDITSCVAKMEEKKKGSYSQHHNIRMICLRGDDGGSHDNIILW